MGNYEKQYMKKAKQTKNYGWTYPLCGIQLIGTLRLEVVFKANGERLPNTNS